MEIWKICLTAAAGYLFGSISVAILVCRGLYGADVRERGSGNAGATNVARVFGMKAGVITFAGDLLKRRLLCFLAHGCWANPANALPPAHALWGIAGPCFLGFGAARASRSARRWHCFWIQGCF